LDLGGVATSAQVLAGLAKGANAIPADRHGG
jgi:hypothetical protein